MAIKRFTTDQIKALNEWSRTQPSLRGVFPYTNLQLTERENPDQGEVGFGDLLSLAIDTIRETDGFPELQPDIISFNSAHFYITQGSDPNEAIINLSTEPGSGSGSITGGVSLGGDVDVFAGTATPNLEFRGLTAGNQINLIENTNDIVIDLERIVTAEAFYLEAGGSFFNEATNRAVLEGDVNLVLRANPVTSPTASARSIFIQSPIVMGHPTMNGAFPDQPEAGGAAALIEMTGTVDATGNATASVVGVDFEEIIREDTVQIFTSSPTFFANPRIQTEGTGSAHTGFFMSGFQSQPVIGIHTNSAARSWTAPSFLAGVTSEPHVNRDIGFTGTITVDSVYAFQSNFNNPLRAFDPQMGAGVTVTEYAHYHAGSGGNYFSIGTATLTTEYGIKLLNISRGATKISLWSDSTTATMRHAGAVSIGKTTAPTVPLDVVGDGIVSDQLRVGSTAAPTAGITLDVIGDGIVSDQLRVGSTAAPAPGFALDVVGIIRGDSSVIGAEFLSSGNGTSTDAAYQFDSDADVGIYRAAANTLGLTGGGETATLTSATGLTTNSFNANVQVTSPFVEVTANGSAATPALRFTGGGSGTGFFTISGTNDIAYAVNGSRVALYGRDGLVVEDKVKGEAFYLEDGGDFFSEPSTVAVGGQVGFLPPRLTTTERDALTAQNGMIIFNTTTGKLQGREAAAWVDLI